MQATETAKPVMDSEALAKRCVEICEDRKAVSVVLYDVRKQSVLADYYLVCTGNSEPHLRAIASHLQRDLAEEGVPARRVEGRAASHWLVLDYGLILIHIFAPELRQYYKIEELWGADSVVHRGGEED
jgi:ribosome-associated protein